MRLLKKLALSYAAILVGGFLPAQNLEAQTFQFNLKGDVMLGFRKTGTHQGVNELVVDLGSVTNFIALPSGATTNILTYTPTVLTDAFPDGYGNLQWSVSTSFPGSSSWVTPLGSFPNDTLWLSLPCADANTPATPLLRGGVSYQQNVEANVTEVPHGAKVLSVDIGTVSRDNNSVLVVEPLTNPDLPTGYNLTTFIGDPADPTMGDFGGGTLVENTTPNTFTASSRCDFYQACPAGLTDPITMATSGNAYFVGYFLLNPNGTLSFVRASVGRVPPPPTSLTISKVAASTFNIYFSSSNSAIYTLYYTNLPGLTAPRHTWATNSTTITGDGTMKYFTVTSTNIGQVFSVGGQ